MKVRIHLLHDVGVVKNRLSNDGWMLACEHDESLSAWHPHVASEFEARQRLQKLGLLTSVALRIAFPISERNPLIEKLAERSGAKK